SLRVAAGATEVAPPQVEFVVHWIDPRGRVHNVLLKRRVPVVPHIELTLPLVTILPAGAVTEPAVALDGDHGWGNAAAGGTFAWELRGDEPMKRSPQWVMAADADSLFIRIRAEDNVHSYTQSKKLDAAHGGLGCDAVSIAWAPNPEAKADSVQRLWVIP